MTANRPPRFRLTVHQLQDGKTTKVVDAYGSGFVTALATLDGDDLEVHFSEGGPRQLIGYIADALAIEHDT